jgi:hypothetical protein
MDSLDQILSMLASLAGVFGFVISYLQYRVRHQREDGTQPRRPVAAGHPFAGPPTVVTAAAVWVVVEAAITVLLLYAVFTTVMADIHSFSFPVPDLPETVVALVPIGLAALIGMVSVPVAIQHAVGLRDGLAPVRSKLLGSAARDLFVGVALAIAAQVFASDMPESVFSVITIYLTYSIISAFVHLTLLLHTHTRVWVESNGANRTPAGRPR